MKQKKIKINLTKILNLETKKEIILNFNKIQYMES